MPRRLLAFTRVRESGDKSFFAVSPTAGRRTLYEIEGVLLGQEYMHQMRAIPGRGVVNCRPHYKANGMERPMIREMGSK